MTYAELLGIIWCKLNHSYPDRMDEVVTSMNLIECAIGKKACLRECHRHSMTDDQFEAWWASERNLYWQENTNV